MDEPTDRAFYTIREAAQALGVSVRTMRRRLADGHLTALPATRGEREVRVIDGAELARYAQSAGLTMATPPGATRQQGAPGAPEGQALGREVAGATQRPGANEGIDKGADVAPMAPWANGGAWQERERALVEQVRALTEERDFLRRVLENTTRALPEARPATVEQRSWWARLWGRRE